MFKINRKVLFFVFALALFAIGAVRGAAAGAFFAAADCL